MSLGPDLPRICHYLPFYRVTPKKSNKISKKVSNIPGCWIQQGMESYNIQEAKILEYLTGNSKHSVNLGMANLTNKG